MSESILQEAERLTNGPRREFYSHPHEDYTRTAGMINAAFAHKLKESFTPEEIMLMMVMVKLSREIYRPNRDNRVDMAGYVNCVEMSYEERERRCKAESKPLPDVEKNSICWEESVRSLTGPTYGE